MRQVRRSNPSATVADPDGDAIGTLVAAVEAFAVGIRQISLLGGGQVEGLGGVRLGDGDFNRIALTAAFDGGTEGIFEKLGQNIFEMGGDVCNRGVDGAVDDEGGPDAVFQFAKLRDKGLAVANDGGRAETGVDDTNVGR